MLKTAHWFVSIPHKLAVLLLAVGGSAAAHAQDGPLFHFTERPGPFRVGLRVVEQYDYSRTYRRSTDEFGKPYEGERARPLQTLIWYPASHADGAKPMTVRDYESLLSTETSFGQPKHQARAKELSAAMAPSLGKSLWAVRDAQEASGRFPLVVYAPSFSDRAWENADLCEFLASQGYVVVASPDMGAAMRSMTKDLAGIEAQARDISFLIGYARTLSDVDISGVAVVGYSWGGISNVVAAARDSRIDALVALDGSMRYFPSLLRQAPDAHPELMTLPLLYISEGDLTIEDLGNYIAAGSMTSADLTTPNVLNAWTHGDLITVRMLALDHEEFSSAHLRNETLWKSFPARQKADYSRADGIAGYAWIARYTRMFLDAYLKHDRAAMEFLQRLPADNGAPPHFLTVKFRAGSGIPPSFDGFRGEVGRRGFDHIGEIYAGMRQDKPDFKLDSLAVSAWADELIADEHLPEAIQLLKLNVAMYPDSLTAYANLGDTYATAGQRQLAIDSYQEAIAKGAAQRREIPGSIKKKLMELQSSQ